MNTFEKKSILRGLNIGDIVGCTNGLEYEFVRMKQSKFIGKREGRSYDIPVEMFVKVTQTVEKEPFNVNSLNEGDLLYILSSKQEVVIYRFKQVINGNRILAENPVTGSGTRIPFSMVEGTVRDLELQREVTA